MSFSISDLESPVKMRDANYSPTNQPRDLLNSNRNFSNAAEDDEIQRQIDATRAEINVLSGFVTAYARNTGTKLSDITPPRNRPNDGLYTRSPFGRELGISDYSPLTSKSGKYSLNSTTNSSPNNSTLKNGSPVSKKASIDDE